MKEPLTIYLAGGLFNAPERLHNLFLEKHLKTLGYNVILPQREALKFLKNDMFDAEGVVNDCQKHSIDKKKIYVGCIDGADADSGTSVEFGLTIGATGRAIVYRTDFRTAPEKELGINAMFRAKGSTVIYYPCYFTELDQVEEYYAKLAKKINKAIKKMKL